MNASADKNSLGAVFDLAAGILKNPAVIEGIITGVSALSASRRVKNPKPEGDGFDLFGIIEMLPQVLPLLSLLKPASSVDVSGESVSAIADSDGNSEKDGIESVLADTAENSEKADGDGDAVSVGSFDGGGITYGTKQEQRENLLLAIRPFLSESRVAAADAMMQINRVSGIFRT